MKHDGANGLTFGIYPGGAIGGPCPAGPPDRPDKIKQALAQLQGAPDRPFIVRAYDMYADSGDVGEETVRQTPAEYDQYLANGRTLDLVAQYHSCSGDIDGYCAFIAKLIDRYGEHISSLQIGEEPNITDNPLLDGAYPRITEALLAGVHTAKDEARRAGHTAIKVGCNSSPLIGPDSTFFVQLARAGGDEFIADLDYIGLDFFPDVFRPVPADRLASVVQSLLEAHRRKNLTPAGLGHLPLVITEHGWPTGPDRTPQRQAEVLHTVIDAISRNAGALNITGYIHHTLRDAHSNGPSLFCEFGLMRDDYTAKPAFNVYRDVIQTLSPSRPPGAT